jgi:hypothetical protein
MKIVISFIVLALASVGVMAQGDAKIVAEIAARTDGTLVKGQPFSAEAVSESVQTLADGNRIVRSSTSKFYRNTEGRTRREMSGGTGSGFGSLYNFEPGVTIMDPGGFRYMIDDNLKTARQIQLLPSKELTVIDVGPDKIKAVQQLKEELRIVDTKKMTDEQKAALDRLHQTYSKIERPTVIAGNATATVTGDGMTFFRTAGAQKYDVKNEDLGTSNMEGVEVTGTRRTTTIPAGAIGNERPIELVYERWYSKELGVVVYSKNTDPRMGEQTYKLTNIVRAEPDPSLFKMPEGYRLISEPGTTYRTMVQTGDKVRVARPKTQQ